MKWAKVEVEVEVEVAGGRQRKKKARRSTYEVRRSPSREKCQRVEREAEKAKRAAKNSKEAPKKRLQMGLHGAMNYGYDARFGRIEKGSR